jgi:hypothetical protein
MSQAIDDPDDPCYYASRAASAECCAYWCARAIAQWATRNATGAQRETDYNAIVVSLQGQVLDLIRLVEKTS